MNAQFVHSEGLEHFYRTGFERRVHIQQSGPDVAISWTSENLSPAGNEDWEVGEIMVRVPASDAIRLAAQLVAAAHACDASLTGRKYAPAESSTAAAVFQQLVQARKHAIRVRTLPAQDGLSAVVSVGLVGGRGGRIAYRFTALRAITLAQSLLESALAAADCAARLQGAA
jgi:hypothetical protein